MKQILVFVLGIWACSVSAVELRIYGGESHEVFLGLLNGSKYDSDSIWNAYGNHGSKYNSECIWNQYGSYGGRYSSYSPFNPYTSTPPVIVDIDGNFYGYLTANKYHSKRAEFKLAELVCSLWEKAYDDLDSVYEIVEDYLDPQFVASSETEAWKRTEIENIARKRAELMAIQQQLDQQRQHEREEFERKRPSEIGIVNWVFSPAGRAPMPALRVWTDHKGGKITARWIGLSNDEQIILIKSEKTGKKIKAVFSKFSDEDQKFLKGEIEKYKKSGYVIHDGWWNKPIRGKESKEIKNGGFKK